MAIVKPTKCGVRRLVAAWFEKRRRVAALYKLNHRAERWPRPGDPALHLIGL